jgi:hypothetical protein
MLLTAVYVRHMHASIGCTAERCNMAVTAAVCLPGRLRVCDPLEPVVSSLLARPGVDRTWQ